MSAEAYEASELILELAEVWEEVMETPLDDLDEIDRLFPEFKQLCQNKAFLLICRVCQHRNTNRSSD